MLLEILIFMSIVVASQGFFLFGLVMALSEVRPLAKYLLAAYIFIEASTLLIYHLGSTGIHLPNNIGLLVHGSFLYGPLLYLYVKAMTIPEFRFGWIQGLHSLPFIISIVISRVIFPDSSVPSFEIQLDPTAVYIYDIVDYLWILCYMLAAMRLIGRYQRLIYNNFSSIDKISFTWLYRFIMFCLFMYGALIVCKLFYITDPSVRQPVIALSYVGKVLFFYIIGIGGYRQHSATKLREAVAIEGPASVQSPPDVDDSAASVQPKYKFSSMGQQQYQEIWQRLNDYMKKYEPYLEEGLRLPQLANKLGVSGNTLSEVMNMGANQSFYNYVNGYRVEKARQLLEDPANDTMSMLDVAMAAGFANNATFHRHFKKRFTKTPLQYKKSLYK